MKICVLSGGESHEREISIKSGDAVYEGLKKCGHDVYTIDGTLSNVSNINSFDYDIVFIALHGGSGEDGTVQNILEEKNIVYTGSGSLASKLAMDKKISKDLFIKNDILTPQYFSFKNNLIIKNIVKDISFPFILKPAKEGSSIGLHLVKNEIEFEQLISLEKLNDFSDYLIEKYIKGREFTVGILKDKALPIIEIMPKGECFDFESKYTKNKCEYDFPLDLSVEFKSNIKDTALSAFNVLGCRGYGRVDIIVDEKENIYVLEVNTIPGFTETSLLPKAALKIGIKFEELCDIIVTLAGNLKETLCPEQKENN